MALAWHEFEILVEGPAEFYWVREVVAQGECYALLGTDYAVLEVYLVLLFVGQVLEKEVLVVCLSCYSEPHDLELVQQGCCHDIPSFLADLLGSEFDVELRVRFWRY